MDQNILGSVQNLRKYYSILGEQLRWIQWKEINNNYICKPFDMK